MKTWIVECATISGEIRRFRFEGVTLKHCREAIYAEVGRHNIVQVSLSNGERERVYDHFPLHFDRPKNNKGRLRSRLSEVSVGLFGFRNNAVQEVKVVLAECGLTLAPITLEGEEGRKVTGVMGDGAEVIDYILFEWKQTEQGNYDFTIHLV